MGILETLEAVLRRLGHPTDVSQFFALFGLALARVATAISLAPFLGGRATSAKIKIGLAAVLCALLYPTLTEGAVSQPISPILLVALLVKEAAVGAVIGILAQFIFYAVQTAGVIIDTQRGMDQPAYLSPQLPGNVSILGNFQFQAALVLFLAMDGHLAFLRALGASYQPIPLLGFPRFSSGILSAADEMIRISASMFAVAVQLAAPIMVALFLVDLAFGALGKVAGRINVHAESQPVKSLVGLGLVLLTAGLLLGRLGEYFAEAMRQTERFLTRLV